MADVGFYGWGDPKSYAELNRPVVPLGALLVVSGAVAALLVATKPRGLLGALRRRRRAR